MSSRREISCRPPLPVLRRRGGGRLLRVGDRRQLRRLRRLRDRPAGLDGHGDRDVRPESPVDVTIAIGPSGTSGGFVPRQMRSASSPDRLNYNLFVNAGRSTVWGNGAAGTSTVLLNNVRRNRPEVTTIYGRIPAGQDVSVGSYFDSLTVTITP